MQENDNTFKIQKKKVKSTKKTGYQLYLSDMMKRGISMFDASSGWKVLDDLSRQQYRHQAMLLTSAGEAANQSMSSSTFQMMGKHLKPPTKSGYQMYLSDIMKSGRVMQDAVIGWKSLDEDSKDQYRQRAELFMYSKYGVESSNSLKSRNPKSGYQMYLSDTMKNGISMSDAVLGWRALDVGSKQQYQSKAAGMFNVM